MTKEMLKRLNGQELLIFASEANYKNDQELLDLITDELKKRKSNEKLK